MQHLQEIDGYEAWRAGLQTPATAELCLRYALSFNKLDASWFLPALAPDVTYESQSVFDVLEGADAVSGYFRAKMLALRGSRDGNVCAELAMLRTGEPCVALFQARDRYQTNWLDEASANTTFLADAQGNAVSIFMITVAPDPADAARSGIYPGRKQPVTESPERFIRRDSSYSRLRFEVFLLDGHIGLDLEMQRRIYQVKEQFPKARVVEIVFQTASEAECKRLDRTSFTGFPAVAAYWDDKLIHSQQGLIALGRYIHEIQKATALYVVAGRSE